MAISKPKNSGYSVILGSTTGSNGSKVDTWIEYKVLSQSIANNTSQVRVILYSQADFDSSTAHTVTRQFGYVQIGSDQQYYTMTGGYDFDNYKLNKFADHTFTIAHNANGTKTVTIKGAWSDSGWSTYITGGSASASVALPTIPQYATANISLGARTETSLTINWSTDQTIDYLWYSTNGGSNYTAIGAVNATSGQFMITGLTANTTYSVKIKVRNKSSQLQSESGASSLATYSYPYASNMPDFTIGNNVTIDFYNPLGRTFTFYVILNDTQISDSNTISTNHFIGLSDASTISHLYECIPSSKSGTYKIKCIYNDGTAHTITKTGGTASAKESDCKPTIGSVSYQDNNSTAYAITGDRSKIVQNISTVGYTASSITAKYSASLASCKVSVNGQTINLTLSGSSASGGSAVIDSGTNVTATFTLTDSRGFTATKTATITMVGYAVPSAILAVERQNNYYSETDITVDADYTHIGTNAVTIQYRARQQGGSYGSWTTIQDNVTATATLDNTYAWDIQIKLTDSFGGTTTYNTKISRGMPIVYFDRLRESVGINCFPANDKSLEVNGYDLGHSMIFRSNLTSSNDLDTLYGKYNQGYYYINGSTPSNSPFTSSTVWTILVVIGSTGGYTQQFFVDNRGGNYPFIWMRQRSGNPQQWGSWVGAPKYDSLFYKSGETFSFDGAGVMNGAITGSKKSIWLTIFTPKSLANINTITVTALTGTIRSALGGINGSASDVDWLNQTGISIATKKTTNNMIRIIISNSTAFTNVNDNTPIAYTGSLSFSFT